MEVINEKKDKPVKYNSPFLNNLYNSSQNANKYENNLDNLDKFLENEKTNNANEPWSKLDKTAKLKKLILYATSYKENNNLDENEYASLIDFFKTCLNKKKLHRVKDVIYDKDNGAIKEIPALLYNKSSNHFTLKNLDKRASTSKSLAPKKVNGTLKNVNEDVSDSE